MNTVAVIQARLGSTRLPGKVLQQIGAQTMLEHVVHRVSLANCVDQIVIATTDQPGDKPLIQFCEKQNWHWHAGSESDVLSRFVGAANAHHASRIIRITSDCPLIEPTLIDQVADLVPHAGGAEYGCNFYPIRRYPRGLDCEVFTQQTLNRLDETATDSAAREHVTLGAYRNQGMFSIASVQAKSDWSDLRWTVDTAEDLELVREIYHHFQEKLGQTDFDWKEVIEAYQQNPNWRSINHQVVQKAA
jgi:spore coat polysaccharide biosynthesis protein SpsF